jgi:hypothetical protein
MRTTPGALLLAIICTALVGCGAILTPSPTPTPIPVPVGVPDFPDSVGSVPSETSPELSDALAALPPASSAESLLVAVAHRVQALRPDETLKFGWYLAPSGESAGAWLQLTGTLDDSIAGEELRVEMEGAEGSWQVVLVESATHCRRAVDAEGGFCV